MQTVTKQLLDFDRKHIQKQIDDCMKEYKKGLLQQMFV